MPARFYLFAFAIAALSVAAFANIASQPPAFDKDHLELLIRQSINPQR